MAKLFRLGCDEPEEVMPRDNGVRFTHFDLLHYLDMQGGTMAIDAPREDLCWVWEYSADRPNIPARTYLRALAHSKGCTTVGGNVLVGRAEEFMALE